ncbi:MAG TPA: tetratricopeptide repeat protein [Candidatus Acidoferrum sp.]|nr:tetratricopeptide repeat protein [Candidatus Acidoferrum sp.]
MITAATAPTGIMSLEFLPVQGDFKIGEWLVSPAVNLISKNGDGTRVEPKAMQVLVYLSEHPGVVGKDQLISAVWPDVFVTDDVLPGCISALRKAFQDNARQPRIIETIHKSGYRLLLPAEPLSANGIAASAQTPPAQSLWQRIRTRPFPLFLAAIVLISIAVAGVLALPSRTTYDSLAVLPFSNSDSDPASQYLSDGIAEQIVNDLSQLQTLKVMAWTTVSRYHQPQLDVRRIGSDLKVKAVLTSRLAREGDHVIVQTELVDVATGSQLWGQRYERPLADISSLQSQLSQDIAENLRLRLNGTDQLKILHKSNASPQAYELYLKGRYFWNKRTKAGLLQGISYFEQAIHSDANFALAYAGLADSYTLLDDWGKTPPRDSFPKARAAAEKAIALDDSLAEAHVSLAMVRAAYDWEWISAEQEFRRAIELNPNYATAHQWYGLLLASLGRFPEAENEVRRAQQLEPLSPIINMAVAEVFTWERRYDDAIVEYKKILELDPSFQGAYGNLGEVYAAKGMYPEALAMWKEKCALTGEAAFARDLDAQYARSGYRGILRGELAYDLALRASGEYTNPVGIAEDYAALGDTPHALEWLQKAYEEHSSGMQFLNTDAHFDSIRFDPKFQYWLHVIGLPSAADSTTTSKPNSR